MQIRIDFGVAVAAIMTAAVILVYLSWLLYTRNDGEDLDPAGGQFRQCRYCLYVFFDYRQETYCRCPRCNSILETGKESNDDASAGPMDA